MTSLFGTTFEYYNFVTNTVARVRRIRRCSLLSVADIWRELFQFRLEEVVEEINDTHVSAWATMLTTSNPPVPNTHLSAYMDTFSLSKHCMAFSNAKIKKVLGIKLKRPYMTQDVGREIVNKWIDEGSWPRLDG